ncbi:hypothetical protein CY34DRAFT_481472 [Suillus luteus UH-Slu-Lm8-n1]|uniref:Uncharacterized protein n=1 Tax=Suillus luteus UH-Slu-Lm8-n1 TaxID=930992 RepID=A0A0D0B7S3_9AGAM|nr:hypothetical protein CY34DRAFT_481472 [Suillus luteus UH-Slu-Lm8-n1]
MPKISYRMAHFHFMIFADRRAAFICCSRRRLPRIEGHSLDMIGQTNLPIDCLISDVRNVAPVLQKILPFWTYGRVAYPLESLGWRRCHSFSL